MNFLLAELEAKLGSKSPFGTDVELDFGDSTDERVVKELASLVSVSSSFSSLALMLLDD